MNQHYLEFDLQFQRGIQPNPNDKILFGRDLNLYFNSVYNQNATIFDQITSFKSMAIPGLSSSILFPSNNPNKHLANYSTNKTIFYYTYF